MSTSVSKLTFNDQNSRNGVGFISESGEANRVETVNTNAHLVEKQLRRDALRHLIASFHDFRLESDVP